MWYLESTDGRGSSHRLSSQYENEGRKGRKRMKGFERERTAAELGRGCSKTHGAAIGRSDPEALVHGSLERRGR